MLGSWERGAILERVLYCDGLGGALVLHWGGVLQGHKNMYQPNSPQRRLDLAWQASVVTVSHPTNLSISLVALQNSARSTSLSYSRFT